MIINLGRYALVIAIVDSMSPINQRRKMARKVLDTAEVAIPDSPNNLRIKRIKAYKQLTNVGLIQAKAWVEEAFTDTGAGGIA
jgi:ribosomal protein L7/L12